MSTPQESITTVNGRRCTRSRARTAAAQTSSPATPPTVASSSTTTVVQQIETSEDASPPPPSSTQAAAAPSSQEAASSGTDTPVPPAVAESAPLADPVPPSLPVPAAPSPLAVVSPKAAAAPLVAVPPGSTATLATNSDSIDAVVTSVSSTSSILPVLSQSAIPVESSVHSTPDQPFPSPGPNADPVPSTEIPSSGSAGLIAPDKGGDGPGLTISSTGTSNIGGIVGGVVGGFAVIVVISILLFLCLRKRRSLESFGKWQKQASEEKEGRPGFLEKLGAIPEKVKGVPAAVGVFVRNMKGRKDTPAQNPYNRQSVRSSVSSVYSVRPNRRSQSMSEPSSRLRDQLRGFGDRMPSLKRSRTLLQKKPDSLVVGAQSPFPGIVEDPVTRNSKGVDNPFADPESLDPPRTLQLLNPDPSSSENTPRLQQNMDGLRDQQRAPISPLAVAFSDRGSRDPFASIYDELDLQGSSTPDWFSDSAHKRTQSAVTALRSHPPSTYTASIYTTVGDNPFFDPSDIPPVPQKPLPPGPPKRPMNAYTAGPPTFNATSNGDSRESTSSFYFGEPGPSRPTTNMYSEVSVASTVPRAGRQSDPFDLDRPEVLGFGQVGVRQVRASVTRQSSKTIRTSSIPNWVNLDDGPYERASAISNPLRNPGARR